MNIFPIFGRKDKRGKAWSSLVKEDEALYQPKWYNFSQKYYVPHAWQHSINF